MNSGILSQEEIDALLRGESSSLSETSGAEVSDEQLSDMEKDAIGEIGNIGMGTAATTLSTLLGKRVSITTPRVRHITHQQLQAEYSIPYVVITVEYTEGLEGSNLLVIKIEDAAVIADLMMGNDGVNPPKELDEIMLSAVSEAMNQMMGSNTTSLSTMFNKRIDISPPITDVIRLADSQFSEALAGHLDNMVQISFRMVIEGLVDSEIMQIIPVIYAKEMVSSIIGSIDEEVTSSQSVAAPEASSSSPVPATAGPIAASHAPPEPVSERPDYPTMSPTSETVPQVQASPKPAVPVQPVQFTPLTPTSTQETGNIGLILDVPLEVSVELGRTRKTIKEILDLGPGSIIQLDRLAGEPVDLLVNGKLVAKGEVVVIDENFGIRVTTIISPVERLTNLQ